MAQSATSSLSLNRDSDSITSPDSPFQFFSVKKFFLMFNLNYTGSLKGLDLGESGVPLLK